AEMKSRIQPTQTELNQILAFGINGELRIGDSMGIWTFDREPHTGQFPMVRWSPEDAASIASGIGKFLGKQTYSRTNNFTALMPLLNQVIQNSPRLTILIFCDGGKISGTPFDDGINQIFEQRGAILKRSKQPFVILLRTQQGKYVGCTINFPPGMVNVPPFPPFPRPAPPVVTNVAPQIQTVTNAPASRGLPLVIIGKRVETNWDAYHFALTNEPAPSTNPPSAETNSNSATPAKATPPPVGNIKTNVQASPPAPVPEINLPPTNVPTESQTNFISPPMTNSLVPTNAAISGEAPGTDRKGTLALAAGFLIGAVALTAWFV